VSKKASHRIVQNICNICSQQRSFIQIYKKLLRINKEKDKQPKWKKKKKTQTFHKGNGQKHAKEHSVPLVIRGNDIKPQ
jgi:hypothetical protein